MIAEQLECDQLLIIRNQITTLIDLMDDLALTNTTSATISAAAVTSASKHRPCLHGSTSDHFSDGRAYRDVVKDYLTVSHEDGWRETFYGDHEVYLRDLNFAQYIFALCTSWYLKMNGTTPELNDLNRMKDLIFLAFQIKYIRLPVYEGEKPDLAKYDRYHRAIHNNDERGVINCLSKETKSYCNCMKEKKTEADNMEIIGTCTGCNLNFPRSGMKKCSGCEFAMFCTTEDCYAKYWPAHKEICEKTKAANVLIGR